MMLLMLMTHRQNRRIGILLLLSEILLRLVVVGILRLLLVEMGELLLMEGLLGVGVLLLLLLLLLLRREVDHPVRIDILPTRLIPVRHLSSTHPSIPLQSTHTQSEIRLNKRSSGRSTSRSLSRRRRSGGLAQCRRVIGSGRFDFDLVLSRRNEKGGRLIIREMNRRRSDSWRVHERERVVGRVELGVVDWRSVTGVDELGRGISVRSGLRRLMLLLLLLEMGRELVEESVRWYDAVGRVQSTVRIHSLRRDDSLLSLLLDWR